MDSSSSKPCPLDVFLSFRGEDTRNNFTSHLHKALCDKGIITFIDNDLKRGDEISPALIQAIEESRISLIIFSKHYASSKWCLQELVKILECKNREMNKHIVIPIFYGVTPSDVRNQTGSYVDAFVKHEQRFKDEVQRWRDVLKEAANLSGWPLSSNEPEALLIDHIVQDVLMRLNDLPSNDTSGLVAIDSKVKEIKLWLCTSDRSVGICGIGGIGKTTLAEAIFNNISRQFEGSLFIDNVREQYNQSGGLNHMQQKLLLEIFGNKNVNIGTFTTRLTFIKNRLRNKKLLIVLDDVSDFQQLESLIGGIDYLNLQSRMIITTRDKQVLRNCGVNQVYEVPELKYQEALKLFCKHAFKENHPKVDYAEISNKVIQYAGGVPLALKILGSYLFGKGVEVWESAVNKLKKFPHKDIHPVLKISYDGLDDELQKIFLDIAIFFKNCDMSTVKLFLNACGFETEVGISVLVDRFLIAISGNKITMHDLLQMMAKEIIRQESVEDPGRRSRLWNPEDICHILTKKTGTEMIEGISLDMSQIRDISLNPDAFVKMRRLRFLEFMTSRCEEGGNKVQVPHGLECDFSELRYLNWVGCPLESLSPSTRFENLVTLEMRGSKLKRLWSGVLHLEKLKKIDLSGSNLTICPDLSGSPNLETLRLGKCVYLREIPPSIQCLNKLQTLYLSFCKRLSSIPNCSDLNSLRYLCLSDCSSLKLLPEMPCNIEQLYLDSTAIEELPSSMKDLSRLVKLELGDCKRLKSLPNSICKWRSLTHLLLEGCCKLEELPNDIGALNSLMYLRAGGAAIRKLPSSVAVLKNLRELELNTTPVKDKVHSGVLPQIVDWVKDKVHSGVLPQIVDWVKAWKNLRALDFYTTQVKDKESWGVLPQIVDWPNLTSLDLSYCGIMMLPDNLGCLSSLEKLKLVGSSFESIPESIRNLSRLRVLAISNCQRLQYLPVPPLDSGYLDAYNCTSLQALAWDAAEPLSKMPLAAEFSNCLKLGENIFQAIFRNVVLACNEFDSLYDFRLCYPGSQIPCWFNFRQEMGSFVKVELPLDWMTMDLAFCVVVAPSPDHEENFGKSNEVFTCGKIYWDCQPNSERPVCLTNKHFRLCDNCSDNHSHNYIFKSNHVFFQRNCFSSFDHDCFKGKLCHQGLSEIEIPYVYFHFKIEDDIKYHEIIKCGVHLISFNGRQNLS